MNFFTKNNRYNFLFINLSKIKLINYSNVYLLLENAIKIKNFHYFFQWESIILNKIIKTCDFIN